MGAEALERACWRWALSWRALEEDDVCQECGGPGRKAYGDTSTWRRRGGGQTITIDVCDGCWGSGSASRPWPSWRKRTLEVQTRAELARTRAQIEMKCIGYEAQNKRIEALERLVKDLTETNLNLEVELRLAREEPCSS